MVGRNVRQIGLDGVDDGGELGVGDQGDGVGIIEQGDEAGAAQQRAEGDDDDAGFGNGVVKL